MTTVVVKSGHCGDDGGGNKRETVTRSDDDRSDKQ